MAALHRTGGVSQKSPKFTKACFLRFGSETGVFSETDFDLISKEWKTIETKNFLETFFFFVVNSWQTWRPNFMLQCEAGLRAEFKEKKKPTLLQNTHFPQDEHASWCLEPTGGLLVCGCYGYLCSLGDYSEERFDRASGCCCCPA